MALALAGLPAGCQSPADSGPDAGTSTDLSATVDMARVADLRSGPDLLARCELPFDQRAIDMVSMGAVMVTTDPGDPSISLGQIDATAGGAANYDKNPFVYVDLINGKKVDITDVQAQQSGAWDIAFKRWQVKINSGDSGPGGVTAAIVANKSLSEVATAPAGPYMADTYFDDKCMIQLDSIGGLLTVLSDWYDYDAGTHMTVAKKEVFVLQRRDMKGHIKLQITGYYKGMAGGNYALSWSLLP